MDFESLKKLAQDALERAKDAAGKATAGAIEGLQATASASLNSAAKSATGTMSTVAGRVSGRAAEAVETLRKAPLGQSIQSIAEGAHKLAKTAVSVGSRIARAAQAAREAFTAEPPSEEAPSSEGETTGRQDSPPPTNAQQP